MNDLDIILESLNEIIDDGCYESTAMEAFLKNSMSREDNDKVKKILIDMKTQHDKFYNDLGVAADKYIGLHGKNANEKAYIDFVHKITKSVHAYCDKMEKELNKYPGSSFAKWRCGRMIASLRKDFPTSNLDVHVE